MTCRDNSFQPACNDSKSGVNSEACTDCCNGLRGFRSVREVRRVVNRNQVPIVHRIFSEQQVNHHSES